jgi:uncharacterized membrane protein
MLSLLLATPLLAAPQQDFSLRLETPTGLEGAIEGIAGFQFSCGWVVDAQGVRHAMRYDEQGPLDLGSLFPGADSEARAVDFSGQVVGWSEKIVHGGLRRQPFRYDDVDGMRALPMQGGFEGWAEDLGIYGSETVGTMRLFNGSLHAWEYQEGVHAAVDLLPTLGGWESEALCVDDGFVGGLLREPSGREHAVIWDRVRDIWFVPTPGTGNARVTDIAVNGRICGYYADAAGNDHGFYSNAHSPSLPVEILPSLGGNWSRAFGLTGGDVIVGSAADANQEARAFRYTISDGLMIDLNDRVVAEAGRVLRSAVSAEHPTLVAVHGELNGIATGYFSKQVTLFASTASAGQQGILSVSSAPSYAAVIYVYGRTPGLTAVPGCPGLSVDITQARVAARGITSEFGSHSIWVNVPPGTTGLSLLVQALIPQECLSTEVGSVTIL